MSTIWGISFLFIFLVWIGSIQSLTTFDRSANKDVSVKSPDQDLNENYIKNFLEILANNLTEKLTNLEINLNRSFRLEQNDSSTLSNYDKHFNCIKNCSSDTYIPKNCARATSDNDFNDGIYLLKTDHSDLPPFYTYCIHEGANETAWMLIQRREDGSVNFNRNWLDYKLGFGNLYGEYWIGLERLHDITKREPYELWIYLKDFNGDMRNVKYSKFSVGSENEGYKLNVNGYSGNDFNDALKHHNHMKFSTFDNDNEQYFRNCARRHKGGWWYAKCYYCDLNGVYYSISNRKTGPGVNWSGFRDYSLKYVHMAIRPKYK